MKRELKEKNKKERRKEIMRYRTIPYEEGTERVSPTPESDFLPQIQNHSL